MACMAAPAPTKKVDIETTELPTFHRRHVADLVLFKVQPGKEPKAIRKLASFFETETGSARSQRRIVRSIEQATKNTPRRTPAANGRTNGLKSPPPVAILASGKEAMRAELAVLSAGAKPVMIKSSGKASSKLKSNAHGNRTALPPSGSPRPYQTSSRNLSRIAAKLHRQDARVIYVGSEKELKTALRLAAAPVRIRAANGKHTSVKLPIEKIIAPKRLEVPARYAHLKELIEMPIARLNQSSQTRAKQTRKVGDAIPIPAAQSIQRPTRSPASKKNVIRASGSEKIPAPKGRMVGPVVGEALLARYQSGASPAAKVQLDARSIAARPVARPETSIQTRIAELKAELNQALEFKPEKEARKQGSEREAQSRASARNHTHSGQRTAEPNYVAQNSISETIRTVPAGASLESGSDIDLALETIQASAKALEMGTFEGNTPPSSDAKDATGPLLHSVSFKQRAARIALREGRLRSAEREALAA